jgi:DNA-binding NtrC family response regulator
MTNVLVVDDNELVRNMSDMVLRQYGHETITADSAAAALAVLGTRDVDVVVTDLTMPGELDGSDLVEQLRRRYPSVGVVVVTGYAVHPSTFDDTVVVLSKPFGVDQLVQAVSKVRPCGTQPA